MKKGIRKLTVIATLMLVASCAYGEQVDFNREWKFWSDTQIVPQVINLPHDAMQTESRSNDVPEGRHNGFYPGNVYHYEKTFKVSSDLSQKHITLNLESVYRNSKVFVNGKEAGGYQYGYMPFDVCLDGLLMAGENTIRVDVDNSQIPNSRWYSGAGIYRPVHLTIQEQQYIEEVKISTLSIAPAIIKVETSHQGGEVTVCIYDGNKQVASAEGDNVELKMEGAKLWSADHPNLYKAVVELKQDGKTIEKQEKLFGIREINWSPQGFKVNGEEVLLKGGCLHHDNGILGAAEYDDAAYRKVAIMKEYGFNAIRSSHNPLSEAMLNACDELGMYVMDELWDMWYITKTKYDYSKDFEANYQEDIRQFVKKDFNHPSVVMYSIGNEVAEPYEDKGVALTKELVNRLHEADNSRPVTAGINLMIIFARGLGMDVFAQEFDESAKEEPKEISSEQYNQMMETSSQQMLQAVVYPPADTATTPVLDALDIAGYNYASMRYPLEGSLHPNRIVVGSETFPHQLAENWTMVEKFPYVIGDFMWTAWDYLGEVNIGGWVYSDDSNITNKVYPWKLSGAGALDLIGNPTGEALLAKAVWLKDNKPYIGVRPIHKEQLFKSQWRGTNSIPSWSWRGCEGMQTVVEVFTSAQKVKLFLNNQLIGEQEVNNHLASFDVTYQPGTLKAVSIDATGKEYEQTLTSATGKVKVSIEPEKSSYKTGELAFVNINLVGENGIVESKADRELTVTVEGGELLGFGSQALITEASFHDGKYPTYYGQSQAIIRSFKPGIVKIHVTGEGVEAITTIAIAQEKQNWLEPTQFNVNSFSNPPLKYAPMTRWWWPGNDVEATELRREVNLFADNHFGGVEIQPLGLVFPVTSQQQGSRIMSFDSPAYYQNIDAVMQEAQKRGLIVDITVGSGWPSGGEHISEAESNLTLKYAVTDIPQGNTSRIEVPTIGSDHRSNAQLVALLAAKVEKESNGTLYLNQQSVKNITASVKEGTFSYSPQESGYKAIAVWTMSAMEQPMLMAKPNAGMVVNHFDAKAIQKNYEYYFGERTCFPRYYGQPLRALFNDSYEFKVDRHFSNDFISTFKTKRGYDPTLTLPANLWDGYNNMYARSANPHKQPAFAFGPEDWRMRYDYDLTLSDVLRQQFMATSTAWTNQRSLLHRSQGYGFNMDIMGVAGSIDIPEGETMVFNYGSEAGYKLITSGAHLYNKPIVTSESAVYINRALLTTPQKMKMVIDKILSAGVNQVIWHGSPYYYKADGQAPEGWRPYFLGMYGINFSSEIYQGNEFWSKMSDVNMYAQRAQYLLRSGKPKADVLIYYPFLNFSDETYNPKELLVKGYIPGVEPATDIKAEANTYNNTVCTEWLNQIYPLIDELNRQGITWDWINDESMQAATLEAQARPKVNVRGNLYQGIVLFNLPYIQLSSAQHLQQLTSQGAQLLIIGQLAKKQPSYKDYAQQDQQTTSTMQAIAAMPSSTAVATVEDAMLWLSKLTISLRSNDGKDIVKQIRREMDNGDLAQFYYNESEQWTSLQVQIDKNYPYAYWMDAAAGTITPTQLKKGVVSYALPPLSTIFLYVSKQPLNISNTSTPVFDPQKAKIVLENDKWDLEVAGIVYKNMRAQDWREVEALKYQDAEGHYDMTIKLSKLNKKSRYFLDLGQVYYTASLSINGHEVGERLWKPYLFDVTPYLHSGENRISVKVTPSRYNALVKRGLDGEDAYTCLKESSLASEGITGKVTLYEQ